MTHDDESPEVVSLAQRRAQAEARREQQRREAARRQAGAQGQAAPTPWLTYAFIGINAAVWLAQVATGVDGWNPSLDDSIAWGANAAGLTGNGQWWRLFTAMFLHHGFLHLAFNLYFLWVVGRICEQVFAPLPYGVIYVASGLFSSLLSMAWHPFGVGVGASGALFGIFGAFLGFTIRRRDVLPPEFVKSIRRNALILLGINLVIGLSVPQIDIVGHIAGFVSGLGLGYLIAKLAEKPAASAEEARSIRVRASVAAALISALVLVAGALAVPKVDDVLGGMKRAAARVEALETTLDAAGEDEAARIEALERALPALRESEAEFHEFQRVPESKREAVEEVGRFLTLARRSAEAELEYLRTGDPDAYATMKLLEAQLNEL